MLLVSRPAAPPAAATKSASIGNIVEHVKDQMFPSGVGRDKNRTIGEWMLELHSSRDLEHRSACMPMLPGVGWM